MHILCNVSVYWDAGYFFSKCMCVCMCFLHAVDNPTQTKLPQIAHSKNLDQLLITLQSSHHRNCVLSTYMLHSCLEFHHKFAFKVPSMLFMETYNWSTNAFPEEIVIKKYFAGGMRGWMWVSKTIISTSEILAREVQMEPAHLPLCKKVH